jgi:hypothetical protein
MKPPQRTPSGVLASCATLIARTICDKLFLVPDR